MQSLRITLERGMRNAERGMAVVLALALLASGSFAAQETINVGTAANARDGDTLRASFIKINTNFSELYGRIGALTITGSTGTLTIGNAKTFTVSNTLTLTGTDGSTLNIGTGGTLGTAAFTAASVYAPLASPALTGNPTAPTQSAGNNSTRVATTAFVTAAVAAGGGGGGSAPWEPVTDLLTLQAFHFYTAPDSGITSVSLPAAVAGGVIVVMNSGSAIPVNASAINIPSLKVTTLYSDGGDWFVLDPGTVATDTGWSANAGAGDKTVSVPNYAAYNFNTDDGGAWSGSYSSAAAAAALMSTQVDALTKKVEALQEALRTRLLPNN